MLNELIKFVIKVFEPGHNKAFDSSGGSGGSSGGVIISGSSGSSNMCVC